MNDIEVLERAYAQETNPKTGERWRQLGWSHTRMGASRQDIQRLADSGFIQEVNHSGVYKSYRLTDKGRGAVLVDGNPKPRVPAARIIEAMELIVDFDDLKEAIANTIEAQRPNHYLLIGPPASAKSLFLECIRQAVPDAEIAFGSRTSAAGLSDLLFEKHPVILLLDEIDKFRMDALSVLLGLMETGEVIETKSKKTRGVKLNTLVLAAGNRDDKLPPEIKSRFAMHAIFPPYTRDQFINVCRQFLPRSQSIPEELAEKIGKLVFDYKLGDIRKARGVCEMMEAPTLAEAERVIQFMLKYSGGNKYQTQRLIEG